MIDSRIRELHVARYGATDDVEAYLHVLETLPDMSDDNGENHHMLAKSIWPEHAKASWNILRIHRGVHTGLTELQAMFEPRLRHITLMMKGQTVDAYLESCRRGGKTAGKMAVEQKKGIHSPEMRGVGGKIQGKIAVESGQLASIRGMGGRISGKMNVESGHLARIRINGGKTQGRKNAESGHMARIQKMGLGLGSKIGGKISTCLRWNIRRGKPCICGKHLQAAAQVAGK
jgi:hypothetical protein